MNGRNPAAELGKSDTNGGKSAPESGNFTTGGGKSVTGGRKPSPELGKSAATGGNFTPELGKFTANRGKSAPSKTKEESFLTPPLQDADYVSLGLKVPDVTPGETPPANPDDLRKSFYTKRKKDLIELGFDDSGKTARFAVHIENEGKEVPLGSALIP
jgi:hypothetical protein